MGTQLRPRLKILVRTPRGSAIGDLIVYRQPKKGKVGVRIDILYPPVYHPRAAPIPERQWVDVGYIPVTVLKLSKNQIQNIKKIEHQATLTPFIYSGRYQLSYLRSHDAVIRVYDNAGNVIETHEHTGDFVEP
jgi:hypothetical protein